MSRIRQIFRKRGRTKRTQPNGIEPIEMIETKKAIEIETEIKIEIEIEIETETEIKIEIEIEIEIKIKIEIKKTLTPEHRMARETARDVALVKVTEVDDAIRRLQLHPHQRLLRVRKNAVTH